MKRDSLVFALAGTLFGVLIGWILGTQQAAPAPTPAPAPAAQQAAAAGQDAPAAPPVDEARANDLQRTANAQPSNAQVRADLGNLYFDAQRFDLAIPWYEQALKLNDKDVDVSTDLGVCYYRTDQIDKALEQFDHSLSLDPKHVKTLFNQGVVRAFGKQDLAGAAESWQKVVAIAPNSPEGKQAQQGLDGMRNGHANSGAGRSGGRP